MNPKKEKAVQLTVKVTPATSEALQTLSSKQHISVAQLLRSYIDKGLAIDAYKGDIDFIRKQINEELRHVLHPQVERLAKIGVKAGIASAASQFLTAELLSSFVHESRRRDYEEVLTEAKKLAVAYFKLRDDEIEQFYRES